MKIVCTLLVTSALIASACSRGRDDVGGTYVVDGELTISPNGAASSRVPIVKETITVKLTSRQYQYGSYEVTLRGCKMAGEGTLVPAVVTAKACTLAGPSGAIDIGATAYAEIKPARGGGVDIHASGPIVAGDAGFAGSFRYEVHGVPK